MPEIARRLYGVNTPKNIPAQKKESIKPKALFEWHVFVQKPAPIYKQSEAAPYDKNGPMQHDLGYIDLGQKTLQTIDNPFGARLLPMS